MPEPDEHTPALAPIKPAHHRRLSPLHLPTKRALAPEPSSPTDFDLDGPLSPSGKAAANALFALSGSSAARPMFAYIGGTKRTLTEEEQEVRAASAPSSCPSSCGLIAHACALPTAPLHGAQRMAKRIRSSRCGTCANCLRPDCGECVNCSDKPKFGGLGVKKQACSARKCLCPNRALNFHDGEEEEEE